MKPLIVPKLDIPVFTNTGFQAYDMHVYVEYLRVVLPDMHPRSTHACHNYLAQMHSAFAQYDMKRFKRLQSQINRLVYKDMMAAEENGDTIIAARINNYFMELRYILNTMRDAKYITKGSH